MMKLVNWIYDHLIWCYGIFAIFDSIDAYASWKQHHTISLWLDVIAVICMLVLIVLVYRDQKKSKVKEEK